MYICEGAFPQLSTLAQSEQGREIPQPELQGCLLTVPSGTLLEPQPEHDLQAPAALRLAKSS